MRCNVRCNDVDGGVGVPCNTSCAFSARYLPGDSTDVRPASVPQELPQSPVGVLQGQTVPGGSHPQPLRILVFFYYPRLHGVRK